MQANKYELQAKTTNITHKSHYHNALHTSCQQTLKFFAFQQILSTHVFGILLHWIAQLLHVFPMNLLLI